MQVEWTNVPPSEEGYYWYTELDSECDPIMAICHFEEGNFTFMGNANEFFPQYFDCTYARWSKEKIVEPDVPRS